MVELLDPVLVLVGGIFGQLFVLLFFFFFFFLIIVYSLHV